MNTWRIVCLPQIPHTDQYLNLKSHHHLHQKLGVVKTLLNRSKKIVTEDTDKAAEETTIKKALQNCGYPDWSFTKVEQQMQKTELQSVRRKPITKRMDPNPVVYCHPLRGGRAFRRVYKSHKITTAMKPHCTLRNMLVLPKDKRDPLHTPKVIYWKNLKEQSLKEP